MKKKRFASLLIVAPLALLAACSSTPSLVLGSNWFSNTGIRDIPEGFSETLEYAVTFEKSASAQNGRFSLDFPNGGNYKTTFKAGEVNNQKTYVYETTLTMHAQYTLDGVSTSFDFDDVIKTHVEFLDVQNELRPLSSWREVHGTVPASTPSSAPDKLENAYYKLDYRTEIVYDWEEETAAFTLIDLASEATEANKSTQEIDVDESGLYFDNEQLFPLLRAAELSSSMVIYTVDPTTRTAEKVAVKDGPTATTLKQSVKFKTDEAAVERDFNVIELSLGYSKQNSGPAQKFTIVQRGARDHNAYRNVILKYEAPVIYSLGTLTYRLTSADFYD